MLVEMKFEKLGLIFDWVNLINRLKFSVSLVLDINVNCMMCVMSVCILFCMFIVNIVLFLC